MNPLKLNIILKNSIFYEILIVVLFESNGQRFESLSVHHLIGPKDRENSN